jgi:glucose-6-phosphate dehydrogenase assembly protein OpcA
MTSQLLPSGHDVPFAQIEATVVRLVREANQGKRVPARSLIATVVIVGDTARLADAADALEQLGEAGGVRVILISEGEHTAPMARVTENAIAINGLAPQFLNNAVAALRLSSLPAVVWWRGGSLDNLSDLARLADRMILDASEPEPAWREAHRLIERTALTDLRWAKLTRWRSAMAHLFDLPQVRDGMSTFRKLRIEAADPYAARLYAGWMKSSLRWNPEVSIEIVAAPEEQRNGAVTPLERVRLEGGNVSIVAQRNTNECLTAAVDGLDTSTRVVPLGDGTLAGWIGEELAIRTRDAACERALASALEIRA